MVPTILAVAQRRGHHFSKTPSLAIRIVEGLGVEGDGHAGVTVKHRSRVRRDPTQPNLRQAHLIHAELHAELRAAGFDVAAGQMGENITTDGLDLLGLPTGTRLGLGHAAVVEVTGLRNPCAQLDRYARGLQRACLDRAPDGPASGPGSAIIGHRPAFYFGSANEPVQGWRRLLGGLAVFHPPAGDETKLRRDETIFATGEDVRKPALSID